MIVDVFLQSSEVVLRKQAKECVLLIACGLTSLLSTLPFKRGEEVNVHKGRFVDPVAWGVN